MLQASIPTPFNVPFASSAGGAYVNPVPVASQISITPGAASFTDGFVPLNFVDPVAGGIPFLGKDVNGVLKAITTQEQWAQAGGLPKYNATFSTAIGGYPNGAVLQKLSNAGYWISTADSNASNPETGGANWNSFTLSNTASSLPYVDATGTADAITVIYVPAITAIADGTIILVGAAAVNATTTPTLTVNGLAAHTIVKGNNQPLIAGDIAGANHQLILTYNLTTTSWVLQNPAYGFASVPTGLHRTANVTPLAAVSVSFSAAHGLAYIPSTVKLEFVCLTAEQTYNIGDVISVTNVSNTTTGAGICLWADATNVGAAIQSTWQAMLVGKTNSTVFTPTAANWAYRFVVA